MGKIAISMSVFSLFYCFLYLVDPFKRKPRNRNSKKLLDSHKFLWTNILVSSLLLLVGLVKFQYGDKAAFAFSAMPLLFIGTYLLANLTVKNYYKREFVLLLRSDSLKEHSILEIVISIFVLTIPLAIPIILLLIWHTAPNMRFAAMLVGRCCNRHQIFNQQRPQGDRFKTQFRII